MSAVMENNCTETSHPPLVRRQRLFLVYDDRVPKARFTLGVGSHLALSARFRSLPPEAGGEMLAGACPDLTVTSSGRAAAYDLDRSRHANHPQPPALRRLRSSAQQSPFESWAVRHRRSAERRLPEDRRTGSASPPPLLRAPCHEP